LRLLLDTNIFISSEPGRYADVEAVSSHCLRLSAEASRGGHTVLVHPSVVEEVARDRDAERRTMRMRLLDRYTELAQPPDPPQSVRDAYPGLHAGSHDWFDHLLIGCVAADAVHGLVTQDDKILRKARSLGLGDRVYTVADALAMLQELANSAAPFLPNVVSRPMYGLELTDPFFDSLRADYPGFDEWFRDKARSGREALVVDGPEGEIAGVCILKGHDDEIPASGHLQKVSTFKVDSAFKGNRYGELLLKALFAHARPADGVWLTVFPKQEELMDLLESFGFTHHSDTPTGERRYLKRFAPDAGARPLEPLAHHVAYGPPALRLTPGQTFITPIQERFHQRLFPDAPQAQLGLVPPPAHGNALRKAYLCQANLRTAGPGATMLFYLSGAAQAVTTVGVLERSLVS
jgi:ribosomal protein S18 acetylase RimI-like enzyme